jgi:membrane associated rhomboid family serine protease
MIAVALVATVSFWRDLDPVAGWVNDPPSGVLGGAATLLLFTFLHGSALHLVFNLFWVWTWGPHFEHRYRPAGSAALMVVLALGSAVPQWLFDGPGIGLSGVVYGWFGFLFIRDRNREIQLLRPADSRMFIGWFFLCIVATELGLMNIANIAHGAGAVVGALVGAAARVFEDRVGRRPVR